jgi:hypothetical protein
MRLLSLLTLCALALFGTACEQHPLPGDPHPGHHGEHDGEKHDAKAAEHPAAAKPADGAKTGEAPKFFPEKK